MLIIDGTYLVYKSYYRAKKFAPGDFERNPQVLLKSVRNNFLKMVSSLKKRFNPSELFIVFDCEGDNFRHRILPSYKSNRKEKPKELFAIKKEIYSFLTQYNFAFQISDDCEADDLIASYVAQNPDKKVNIFTGDADLGALVNENVSLLLEKKQKINVVTPSNFHYFFQVPPNRLAEFKALQGDKSDFVKGVEGLFRNETVHLFMEFNSIHDFFEQGTKHYLFPKLFKNKDKILQNLSVTNMQKDRPISVSEFEFDIKNITLPNSISYKIKW